MAAKDSALVLVLPSDGIDAIMTKVRDTGATNVQLLVPDDVPILQSSRGCALLQSLVQRDHIGLVMIASDERVLAAAKQNNIETMGVQDARVQFPTRLLRVKDKVSPYATGKLMESAAPSLTRELSAPATAKLFDSVPTAKLFDGVPTAKLFDGIPTTKLFDGTPTAKLTEEAVVSFQATELDLNMLDAELLRALSNDHFDEIPPKAPSPAPPKVAAAKITEPEAEVDFDFSAELDNLSLVMSEQTEAPAPKTSISASAYDSFTAEMDDLSELLANQLPNSAARSSPRPPKTEPPKQAAPAKNQPAQKGPGIPNLAMSFNQTWLKKFNLPQNSQGKLIVLLVLIVLALVAFIFFRLNSVAIMINLPSVPTEAKAFQNLLLPIAQAGSANNEANEAVQAEPISADVVYTATSQIHEGVKSPATSARGVVNVYNQAFRAVEFLQGTEFIATNAAGQEVHFTADQYVVVPPASTSQRRQGLQIITVQTMGQAQVPLTARTPGTASNVDADTIRQIVIPGQSPLTPGVSNGLELHHDPLTGGTEALVYIVRDTDVSLLLPQAVTGLCNQATKVLETEAKLVARGRMNLEPTTIAPNCEDFGQGQPYDVTVVPPVGQPVSPDNLRFEVVVRARFNALATPPGKALKSQIEQVLPGQLAREMGATKGMKPLLTNWHWDGSKLTMDGTLTPTGEAPSLDPQTKAAILAQVKGKSRKEVEAALNQFVQKALISGYTLPDRAQLPTVDFLLEIQVQPPKPRKGQKPSGLKTG